MRRMKTSELALGCMGMSDFYGASSEAENLRVLDHAVSLGLRLIEDGPRP